MCLCISACVCVCVRYVCTNVLQGMCVCVVYVPPCVFLSRGRSCTQQYLTYPAHSCVILVGSQPAFERYICHIWHIGHDHALYSSQSLELSCPFFSFYTFLSESPPFFFLPFFFSVPFYPLFLLCFQIVVVVLMLGLSPCLRALSLSAQRGLCEMQNMSERIEAGR